MAMGRGGAEGWGLCPRPAWFCLAPPCMTGKTFLPHPHPLGPGEALSLFIKLYFLLICPITSTIF